MELGDIIKWVDRKNQDLRNAEFNQILMEDNQQNEIVYEKMREYNPEYDKYSYALIPHILQLSEDSKKALIRRLFRNSGTFFHRCVIERKGTDDGGWVFFMQSRINYLSWDDEDLFINPSAEKMIALEYELLGFYSEIIQLCVECGLNPDELHTNDIKKEVIEDIVDSMRSIPAQKENPMKKNQRWQDYIIGNNKEKWIRLIRQELEMSKNKNGKLMATIILALGQTGSILNFKKSVFYKALRVDFPLLNSDEAINKYLNTYSTNAILQSEIDAIKIKVGCI
jgi:hypothetical protein